MTASAMAMWKWELLIVGIVAGVVFLGWLITPMFKRHEIKPVVAPRKRRTWTVPDTYAETLWDLWTKWMNDSDYKARYQFWKAIGKILPETKDIALRCNDGNALKIIVEESFTDDDEEEDED
jgi:hypothetical protein